MKIMLLDSCFSLSKQKSAGMAFKCIKWQLEKSGIEVVKNPQSADYIFITSVHPQGASYARKYKKYKKPIVFGGAGALSPSYYLNYCDYVVVGDGQKVINNLSKKKDIESNSNVLYRGKNQVDIDYNFPFDCPPIQQEDGRYSIWCGRGCKNKCFFCQTGWALKYQENPKDPTNIAKQLLKSGRKISYLSNDLSQHKFYKRLPVISHGSYSIRYIKKNGLPPARQLRLGIEGVSERLRAFVNKKIESQELVKITSWLNQNKKGVRWFMICGLPTETAEDWQELKQNIMDWKKITPTGVLELSFTAWSPEPATPLATFAIDDNYWNYYKDFSDWFFEGIGFSNRIKIYKPQLPENRIKKAIAAMDIAKKDLYLGGNWGPNDIVDYPYKKAAKKINKALKNRPTN